MGTLKEHRLDVPQITLLADLLRQSGLDIPLGVLTREELVDAIMKIADRRKQTVWNTAGKDFLSGKEIMEGAMSLILDKINYVYSEGTAYQIQALKDVNLEIKDGQFIGVIGHTGSGKSTLIQHLNGLVKATSGTIYFNGQDIYDEDFDLRELRNRVGLVFQYPEHQLFETTIFDDVCFGPKNQGLSKEEAGLRI